MNSERKYDGFVKVDVVKTPAGEREVVESTDSVAILVYNRTSDEVLLVTQDRVPMCGARNITGTITEVPAGRLDRKIGVRGLVVQELAEELGVTRVHHQDIRILNADTPVAVSPGLLTERQYLAYVEITSDQIDPTIRLYGAPEEGERIERLAIPVAELPDFVCQDLKTWALVQWFLQRQRR